MSAENKQTPKDRLNYSGDLEPVVGRLCSVYDLGKPTDFSVVEIGYEDCNVIIQTPKEKYLAKIFSKVRTRDDILRYTTIMQKVSLAGINHPPMLKTSEGLEVFNDKDANGISLVVMKYIEGKTFLELDLSPDDQDRQAILEQASKINALDYHPSYVSDSWAIPNIEEMFDRVRQFIEPDDIKLVEEAMKRYLEIPLGILPKCFVHGDFTKSNIIKSADGKIYILDFSVANWYPRIQELAVINANLLHDVKEPRSLKQRSEIIASEYSQFAPLTEDEKNTYIHILLLVSQWSLWVLIKKSL